MRVLSLKTAICSECGDDFTWKTARPTRCVDCRRKADLAWREKRRREQGQKPNELPDHLPPVDWVMERQFRDFFDLMGMRYKDIKDVSSVVNQNSHKPRVLA